MASALASEAPVAALPDPQAVYAGRLAQRQQAVELLDRRLDRLGLARLTVFAAGLVLAATAYAVGPRALLWGLLPLAGLFLSLLIRYDIVARRLRRARRAVHFYALGLERLDGRWRGQGEDGQRYLDEDHVYALDLDVFGPGSLFERLGAARTRLGADTLAGWLRAPAAVAEVCARQEAVAELRPRLDLRERLALLGAELPPVDYALLTAWGAAPPAPLAPRWRLVVNILAAVNAVTVLVALTTDVGWLPFAAAGLVSLAATLPLRQVVADVLGPAEAHEHELALLAGLLAAIEGEPLTSGRLRQLQAELRADGLPASRQIGRLALLVDWVRSPHNQFFAPIAALLLWRTRMALHFEAWRRRSGAAIGGWLHALGEAEALSVLAGYAYENPADPFPEVVDGPALYEGEGLGHPLLPSSGCVRNDVRLGGDVRLLLVSGSNMSGKSTLLRTVGANAVLALAGAPVRARRLRLTPVALGATLRVQDSLLAGRSRFFAEISRLRRLLDLTCGVSGHSPSDGPLPLLFLLDELLHGTNSHDRGVGADAVLRRLLDGGAFGLATTHDLALTQLAVGLGPRARNVHFVDEFANGEMLFDYRLRPGVVPHSNALALMKAIGLEV